MPSIRADSAVKRFSLTLAVLFSMVPQALARQNNVTNSGAWSGIVVSSACNADEAFNESPECLKDVPGAKLSLYDDTNRVMYGLEPQESVTARLGDAVTVRGTLDGDTVHMASIELMSIGLAVGQTGSSVFGSRPVRPGTNSGYFERNEWHSSSVFPFSRLVTVLQGAAGPAAKRDTAIRKARGEASGH